MFKIRILLLFFTVGIVFSKLSSIEKKLFKSFSLSRAKKNLKKLTSIAHIAGSKNDKILVDWTVDQFKSYGLNDVTVEEYWPLINFPAKRSLTLLKPTHFEASLTEDVIDSDKTSRDQNAVPTFHGYGGSGDVTGKLIYVNYGSIDDFRQLKDLGVDFKGSICIVKYGGMFRGVKVRAAELAGCAGCIIYSDPFDDGFVKGKVYPEGPWRPPTSVQRGSVQYNHVYQGDALTPGKPALKNATRLPFDDANIPKIPSLPISYADAEPLLKALVGSGHKALDIGKEWQGGLKFDYFTGPGEATVRLNVNQDYKIRPIWNVIVKIEGEDTSKIVLAGNHRDAWVFGAVDPNSGTAALLETGKGLGDLLKTGWKPKRSIWLCSWDAEEYGLIGSTEFVENHIDELKEKGVTYINVDTSMGDNFASSATPNLSNLIRDVTKDVKHHKFPEFSVYDKWLESSKEKSPFGLVTPVGGLGAGSDFVPFLQHAGISSISLEFRGEYGVYHSNYDSFYWIKETQGFKSLITTAEIYSLTLLRLSDSEVVPMSPLHYWLELFKYSTDLVNILPIEVSIKKLLESVEVFKLNSLRFEDRLKSINDNKKRELNFQKEENINYFNTEQENFKLINEKLIFLERKFCLFKDGIGKRRKWYKHFIYAPGEWAGYDLEYYPSIREVLSIKGENRIQTMQYEVDKLAGIIKVAADYLGSS
ncbi:hypothetical protein HK099_000863 [Clydaea vesicula]|uniref:Uncharacterized protein n=1 Tax=Clydaea vesicula TaxID=447962 RepID=A0AAD5TUA6_9FUNG|nr:hypothetical protein HK099_000863 [Clydaea vesicula]KAJ3386659.1 hypothetical protein HDU92_002369 [Lobulomyces angularis]